MKVHLIKKRTILHFIEDNPSSKSSFEKWLTIVKYADWLTSHEIKLTVRSADILGQGSNRVVFNIAGNRFRMICKYHFGISKIHLFVCWIGSHTEYDEICNRGEQYTINKF